MKKTPDKISKQRQSIGQELSTWHRAKGEITLRSKAGTISPAEAEKKIAFCDREIVACRKRMSALRGKGKKTWTFKTR